MSKKIVIKADLVGQKCKSEILTAVSKLEGIKSLDIDADKCTLTVVGTVDPVCVVLRLKKKCFAASIVSVEDDKPKKEEEPGKEACEKLCKEKCDKLCCCKECKEKCKEKCEKACEAWLGKGCCSCSHCKPGPAGFCYDYSGVPSCYPNQYGCPSSYPYYARYEERSPDGACAIQ
ncbi:unnamed protein product [Urochloa humidicola]